MSNRRDEKLYFEDILESANAIKEYTDGVTFDDFIKDRKTYSATIREYIIIGEAISKIIDLLNNKFPDYPWKMIKDFRNFIVHEYFGVDPEIVWDITTKELDEVINYIKELHE